MEPDKETENKTEEIKIDRQSKILFAVLGILIAGSVAATFWRYIVKHDYIVQAQTDCDPENQNCFVWKCDPMSLEEGEKCTGNPENDIWYYKIIHRNAKNIPLCDPNDENCAALVCEKNEVECEEELCTAENVPEGEECNDPEKYILENPPEEENIDEQSSEECEEGDEACLAEEETPECDPSQEDCSQQPSDSTSCDPATEDCSGDSQNTH